MKNFILVLGMLTLCGCAGIHDSSLSNEEIVISETQTMAGDGDESISASKYNGIFAGIENTAQYDLVALAKTDPNLTTFVQLIEQADMASELSHGGQHTLFIPINDAFSELSEDSLHNLMAPESRAQLIRMLQAHILAGILPSTDITNSQHIESSAGDYLSIDTAASPATLTVGGATVLKPDVRAGNGIIHIVDRLLVSSEGIGRY
ncbi:fasciclin domain-containing protein [Pontibacter oryzae]|nr:fasciclin domain-containing protein [Pontibacter oryzae]